MRYLEQALGLWALRFLIATLTVTPLRQLFNINLLRYRRALGLLAFYYAALHLTTYLVLDQGLDIAAIVADIVKRPYITIGMATFVILVPLAVTSNNAAIRRMGGQAWAKLHRLVYVAAIGAVLHFILVVKSWPPEPLVYAAIVAVLLGYRLVRRTTKKGIAETAPGLKSPTASLGCLRDGRLTHFGRQRYAFDTILRRPVCDDGSSRPAALGVRAGRRSFGPDQGCAGFRSRQPEECARRCRRGLDARDRQEGHDLLCRQQCARQADRGRCPGGSLLLRRSRLDGLPGLEGTDQAREPRQPARQFPRPRRTQGLHRCRSRSSPGSISPRSLAATAWRWAHVDAVPAGKYGKAALEHLGAWAGVKDKIAQADNVRAALLLVSRGEAPLGIVYKTDAVSDPNVSIVATFPEESHPPIVYPVALTKDSSNPDARGVPGLPALGQDEASLREAGLHVRRQGDLRLVIDWLSPEEWTAVRLSLKVALVAMTASLIPGIAIALLLERGRFWGRQFLDVLVHLPLVLPPVVVGWFLLIGFGRRGPIGSFLSEQFGIVFSFRWTGAALACAIMGFPLLVRAIRLSIAAVDRKLEDAAGTLGAHPVWVFAVVTLPLIVPGIIAGMVLSFAKAMGEFGATITFVSNIPGETQTIPSAIYTYTQVPGGESGAMRLTLVSIVISVGALWLSEWLARRMRRRVRA